MRRDVAFDADGTALRGWLYLPDGAAAPVPAVVMAHGFAAVKEQGLDRYAEVFAAAGLGALVFDHRNFGASDGTPRQELDGVAQARDYRHAVTFARTLSEVDRDRIGVWGTSYSGGHALVVGGADRRGRCVRGRVCRRPTTCPGGPMPVPLCPSSERCPAPTGLSAGRPCCCPTSTPSWRGVLSMAEAPSAESSLASLPAR